MGEIMDGLDHERRYGILDAERELIAAILADNRGYRAVCHLLQPGHFLSPGHQRQFATIAAAIECGRPIDPALLVPQEEWSLAGLPPIDPLDYALMIYGSFLGREAVNVQVPALAM